MSCQKAKKVVDAKTAEQVYEEERRLYSVLYADSRQVEKRGPGRPRKHPIKTHATRDLTEYNRFISEHVKMGNTFKQAALLWSKMQRII